MTPTISGRPAGRRRALAAAALACALAPLSACGESQSAADPAGTDGSPTSPAAPATPGSPGTADPDLTSPADTATVPAYWLGHTPQGLRLFREDVVLASAPESPAAAAAEALAGKPADADYSSAVGHGIDHVTYDPRTGFTVILADDSLTKPPAGKDPHLAVQQLVYTLNAAQQVTGKPMTATLSGAPVKLFGVDTSKGVRPADQAKVLATVNVLAPTDGAKVTTGRLSASGLANSPEANVPWQITDASGKALLHGAATASGWMDRLYPWSTQVDVSTLPAGTYTFTASTDDPSDGEGPGPTVDTKTIIIE